MRPISSPSKTLSSTITNTKSHWLLNARLGWTSRILPRRCAASCARTPTSSWSAKCATLKQLTPRIDKPGRVAVFEIMINTPSIAALIRDNKSFRIQSDIQTGAKYGMVTLDGFLVEKYLAGLIAREEVVTKAQDPVTIQAKLQELELAQAVGADAGELVQGKV